MKKIIVLTFVLSSALISAQTGPGHSYVRPSDPLVRAKLNTWQDLKFGLLMHWGLYSRLGIVESWPLCSEDQPFQDRGGVPYTEFKTMYFSQIEHFNPVVFYPESWAAAAKKAGMRYVIFTAKHHDGFCMWDTGETDFSITGPRSPFRGHAKADITKEVLSAFRKEGFMCGLYFSKADWHHPDYWSPLWATPDRNNNYDVRKYPDMWQRFRDFTYNQIQELMTSMGPVDILWLDAGWVRPDSTINDEVRSWGYDIPKWEQDIDMGRIVSMARSCQPGLIVVNRSVHGPYENYRTPEQHVPDKGLAYPFEANMTMTSNWGYVRNAVYKPAALLVRTLVDVVAKGGNFLLNIGPTPQGTFEKEACDRLEKIGRWMEINSGAIYETIPWKQYHEGENIRFTCSKDGSILNVFLLTWPGEKLVLASLKKPEIKTIAMLGDGAPLVFRQEKGNLIIDLPAGLREKGMYVWAFQAVLK